jgi:acyl carrier protein
MTPRDQLYQVLNRVLQIDPSQYRDDIGPESVPAWDSLRHLAMVSELEDTFEIEFGMNEISRMRCIGDIKKCLTLHDIHF